jgi:hypothetical protein
VSADREAVIMTVYPSIAATSLGQMLGGLYESLPGLIYGIKLSHLLFPLPTAPLGMAEYIRMKLMGDVYVVTNRSVQKRKSLGNNLVSQVPLSNVADVVIRRKTSQEFYKAGDLSLRDKQGQEIFELTGVPYPDVFRQTILEASRARSQVESSLSRIAARQ